ncbi:hypothetical protein [Streptomyces sp. S1D4-20]|uniref:hypothetical protein n=1 Tax=Streptomyces sp. S1D4-20 TaxID=2594462 RepID=UPI001163B99A|nr:hypothetical protein [Streptomyces sp. S1D4-20]QDN54069.1 hypothetical protein FNV67_00370 [Streptomyces sp. S1D4-20]
MKSSAAIVAEVMAKAKVASANVNTTRGEEDRAHDRNERANSPQEANRMFAEGVLRGYEDLGANADGTLYRPDGEDEAATVERLRGHRRTLIRKLLFAPEQMAPGIDLLRQHYDREGAKRFLSETSFVAADGEL